MTEGATVYKFTTKPMVQTTIVIIRIIPMIEVEPVNFINVLTECY